MNKLDFLQSIMKEDGSFKRMQKVSPLRYPGGKTRAIGLITQYLPDNLPKKILSPFAGGASLEIAWAQNLDVDEVVACDVFWPLVNFWNHILNDPKTLADRLRTYKLGKDNYMSYRQELKDAYEGKTKLDDLTYAAHFYHNMQLSYGPLFLGWPGKKYKEPDDSTYKDYENICNWVESFSCPKLKVEHIPFEKSLDMYSEHYVYADPPYLLGYDSDVFRPMYPNQKGENHKNFNHELFKDMMRERKTDWMVSYNDCGTIRNWFEGFEFQFPKWQYSLQQGETRKNGVKGDKDSRKESKEILVIKGDYTLPKPKLSEPTQDERVFGNLFN